MPPFAEFVPDTVTVLVPLGVPELEPPEPMPLQPTLTSATANARTTKTGRWRRCSTLKPSNPKPVSIKASANTAFGVQTAGIFGREIGRERGGALPAAVVLTVRVTLAVVVEPLNVRDVTAVPFCVNVHEDFAGRPEHARLLIDPVKPLTAVKVSVAVPDFPAPVMVIVEGAAASFRKGKAFARLAKLIEPRPVARS